MIKRLEKLESKLKLDVVGINYFEEIRERERGGIVIEPYYYFGQDVIIKILKGFDKRGFNPKDNKSKREVIAILRKNEQFPIHELNKMGVGDLTYRDHTADEPYSERNSAHFSLDEFEKMERPLEILKVTKTEKSYKKIC